MNELSSAIDRHKMHLARREKIHQQEDQLRTKVKNDAQRFVDEPVYVEPNKDAVSIIARSISFALNGADKTPKRLLVAYDRVALRWIDPDGKGGTRHKYPEREKNREDQNGIT